MEGYEREELQTLTFGKMAVRTYKTALKNYGTFFVSYLAATCAVFIIMAAMMSIGVPQFSQIISTNDISLEFIPVFVGGTVILTLISLFFAEQFSTGLVYAAVKEHENGNKLTLGGAYSLAISNYKYVTKTLLALLLCSLGVGAAAIPFGIVAIIPIIGAIAIVGLSYMLEIISSFSVCAAAADNKSAFGAIKFGAALTFYGGFFTTLLQIFLASVIVGIISILPIIIIFINMNIFDLSGFELMFNSGSWYLLIIAFWIIISAISPFLIVFTYYIYANAKIRAANKARRKMQSLENERGESWEAYKEDEAKKRWEELREGCHVFGEDKER